MSDKVLATAEPRPKGQPLLYIAGRLDSRGCFAEVPKIIEGMAVAAVDGDIVIGWEEVVPMLSRRPVSLRFRPAIQLHAKEGGAGGQATGENQPIDKEPAQEASRRRQEEAAAVLR